MNEKFSWLVILSISVNLLLLLYVGYQFFLSSPRGQTADKKKQKQVEVTSPSGLESTILSIDQKEKPLAEQEVVEKFEDIKLKLRPDDHLQLVKYNDRDFKASRLRRYLGLLPNIRIYVLLDFTRPATFKAIQAIEDHGFAAIKPKSEYLGKKLGVFYGKYRATRNLLHKSYIKDIYLLNEFTANGNYTLSVIPEDDLDDLQFNFHLPFSKPGRELIERTFDFIGYSRDAIKDHASVGDRLLITMNVRKKKLIKLFSRVKYKISLEELLRHHIRVIGHITIEQYKRQMNQQEDLTTFTAFSEKIVISDYINEVAATISETNTLNQTWAMISKRLDRDIRYDYDKRFRFFNGMIIYRDIKDMYMTAAQLGEKKVGACPERSSLEAAILRKLGVAARTATRLYHIYTEILMPQGLGWVTTSGLIKEIPLCESQDEKQSYFVSWSPEHPIRLKWEGGLYPAILY